MLRTTERDRVRLDASSALTPTRRLLRTIRSRLVACLSPGDTARAYVERERRARAELYRPASLSRFIDLLDEEVEFDLSAYPDPGPAVLRGKEAAIDWCRSYWGTWD
jgi:hypothetical protein